MSLQRTPSKESLPSTSQPKPVSTPEFDPQHSGIVETIRYTKVPAFWKARPELWFYQVESVFSSNRITADSTKYHLTVAALDSDALEKVSDIIASPPESGKYDLLKTSLLKRLTESADKQLHKALTELHLGDLKPSQLLRRMRSLVGDRASEDVLRVRWIALLPPATQNFLKIFRETRLDELASAADELTDTALPPSVAAVSCHSLPPAERLSSSDTSGAVSAELKQIREALTGLIAINRQILSKVNITPGRSRSRSSHDVRPPRDRSLTPTGGVCYYHKRFGDQAHHCTSPCSYASGTSSSKQEN